MKMKAAPVPLGSSEVAELRHFLESAPGVVSLPELEGMLAAVASSPEASKPSEWIWEAIGEQRWKSREDAERVLELMLRFQHRVSVLLDDGAGAWLTDFEDPVASEQWCRGFLRGARLDVDWKKDELSLSLLFPFAVLAREFDLVGQEEPGGTIIRDPSRHMTQYRETLDLYISWRHQHRKRLIKSSATRATRIHRNDPCPCGSGLKYKRCCL